MMIALVGHRGVGKTSLLKRIESYYHANSEEVKILDLDNEIEKSTGRTIGDIFSKDGENAFRLIEGDVLQSIYNNTSNVPTYVALGAGYQSQIPEGMHVIWVQRVTDVAGRVFTNRPRLDVSQTPLNEYFSRWEERQKRYRQMASETLILNEGKNNTCEKNFFLNTIKLPRGSALTLFPHHIVLPDFKNFIQKRLQWGYQYFELRDDLLTEQQVNLALKVIPKNRVLLSFRKKDSFMSPLLTEGYAWDWALELGLPPNKSQPTIVSLHEQFSDENFEQALSRLSNAAGDAIQKCALMVNDWSKLQQGHHWSIAADNRSFLPRSKRGRWQWYRWLTLSHAPVSFVKEDLESSAADQPTLLEAASRSDFSQVKEFAAIIGWPVDHSWTPSEQQPYFANRGAPVLRIPVNKDEVTKALDVLSKMGLRWSAVTSPLKQTVYDECTVLTQRAQKLQSVNTLQLDKNGWIGHNTDWDGLKQLFLSVPLKSSVAVWGGGGTLSLIKELLPQAKLYSARTGKPRIENDSEENPDIVIWACGRFDGLTWPPVHWCPKTVIDLSYAENSAGKEYALIAKSEYQSGESMFFTQAKEQRRFWDESSK